MKIENVSVMNIENAIRGMRNAMNSWDKSDSGVGCCKSTNGVSWVNCLECPENFNCYGRYEPVADSGIQYRYFKIGEKDMELAKKLVKAGSSDRKFLRQIFVSMDITGPIFWWKEMSTYKVATVANSTSTMHKLASTPITLDCFEIDDYDENLAVDKLNEEGLTEEGKAAGFIPHWHIDEFTNKLINHLEELRQMYLKTKDKKYWKELIRWLPEGWLQTRTWTADYETLRNIYHQRKNHKLSEWHNFCTELEKLPYAEEFIIN